MLLRIGWLVGAVLWLGCGAKTSIPGGFEGLDVLEAEERASGQAGGAGAGLGVSGGAAGATVGAGPFLEDCYIPGKDGRPTGACLLLSDPLLPALFPNCPFPAVLKSGPITDINITTGITRCCYEISGETCE